MHSSFFQRAGIIIWLCLSTFRIGAQEQGPKYLYEIGGGIGGSFYMGDANRNSIFYQTRPAAEAIFRYNINFRYALKANLAWAQVSGSTEGLENVFPNNGQVAFQRNVIDLGGQVEFNFFPYSDEYKYLSTKPVSPYIAGGLGFSAAPGGGSSFFSPHLSLGTGVKYKLKNRINIGAEWTIRKLFSDRLDVNGSNELLNDPYGIGSGLFKNKDWYSMLTISITYDFGLRDCNCNRKDMKIK
jgi:hypothetical protein